MKKALPITIIFLLLTLSMTPLATAQKQNIITNETTETLYVISSTKFGAQGDIPAGYRTSGWKTIAAGEQRAFWAYDPHKIYFQIWKGSEPIKPQRSTETFAFWINRNANFDIVTRQEINSSITRAQLLYSSHGTDPLTHRDGFMVYNNGSRITVTNAWVDVEVSVGEEPMVEEPPEEPMVGPDLREIPVNIPDTNLRAAIEEELGKATGAKIIRADMQSLGIFEAPNRNIQDLTGLEFATNLHWLDLYGNQIADLSPLTELINLEDYLDLSGNQILDVSPLANLKNLTELYLIGNQISDVSPLANLKNLTALDLSNNQISDFAPIAGLIPNLDYYSNDNQRAVPVDPNANQPVEVVVPNVPVNIPTVGDSNAPVNIRGSNLRAVIERALGKTQGATITQEDMLGLTVLDLSSSNIQDLTGLEFAINLRELELRHNAISDVSPLARLINLTRLYLSNNAISDVSSLARLINLTYLNIQENKISDVSPLAGLINLETLYLNNNAISDVSSLTGLINLETLGLANNTISDVSSLTGLINLETLYLYDNTISDVSPLTGLINLETLLLSDNAISDVSPLRDLRNLTYLGLSGNRISDFFPIAGVINNLTTWVYRGQTVVRADMDIDGGLDPVNIPDLNLRATIEDALDKRQGSQLTRSDMQRLIQFSASDREIQDLTGLEFATSLTDLDLEYNAISDVSPLAGLINLTWLDLSNNAISDVSPLTGLINLTWLDLSDNTISDISPLAGLISLTDLDLDDNTISDVSPLTGLINLTDLDLSWNAVLDISPLAGLINLEWLDLYKPWDPKISDILPLAGLINLTNLTLPLTAAVSDISPLAGLINLEWLHISGGAISDISPLAGLINLTYLRINENENKISDISPLTGLINLTWLDLNDNAISDISPLTGLINLTYLKLRKNKISDISLLAGLRNLKTLELNNNAISDVSPLAGLINLTWLLLSNNAISDVSPLVGLINLTDLRLSANAISDASPLTRLTNLRSLSLEGNYIVDFSPISGLIPLLVGDYTKQNVGERAPINIPDPNLRAAILKEIGQGSNSRINAIDMLQIKSFAANNQGIQDLTGLEYALNLRKLDLRWNDISDVSPLAGLTNLTLLNLEKNTIDVSSLTGLINLEELNLEWNAISDADAMLNFLVQAKNLNYVYLLHNPIYYPWGLPKTPEQNPGDGPIVIHLPDHFKPSKIIAHLLDPGRGNAGCGFNMPPTYGRLQPSTHVHTITKYSHKGGVSGNDGKVKAAPGVKDNGTVNWTYETTVASESKSDPTTITVKFLNGKRGVNGDKGEIDVVEAAARTWEKHGYLRFKFLDPGQSGASDIRVKFKYDYIHEVKAEKKIVDGKEEIEHIPTGKVFKDSRVFYKAFYADTNEATWLSYVPQGTEWLSYKPPSEDHKLVSYSDFSSYLGTDANNFKNQATMNLTLNFSFGTALHEFGHALGLIHEHLSPKFKDYFKWKDTQAVYDHYQNNNPGWTREDVEWNVLDTRSVATELEGVYFDPNSIMTYGIPANLIEPLPNAPEWAQTVGTTIGIVRGTELSIGDQRIVATLYPEPKKLYITSRITVYAKDDDVGSDDWYDNRNLPSIIHSEHTHHSPLVKYLHLGESTYLTDGDREVRVEVHRVVRNFRYSDKTLELGVYALLYEDEARTGPSTDDLEDIVCKGVRVPIDGTKTVVKFVGKSDRLKNRGGPLNLKWNDNSCPDFYEHGELYLGDATGGGDWAEVTVEFAVYEEDPLAIIVEALAPSRISVQDASSVDVNGDGQVDAADLVLVSNYIGQTAPTDPPVDVNSDGFVTIADLVQIAQYFGQSTTSSAPFRVVVPTGLKYATVEEWIHQARLADDGSLVFRQGIVKLEYLLTLIIPEKTALLPNYPNPFNPETWIPYHLAEPADVTFTIYSIDGKVVRHLDLGHQAAGYYQSKARAAYWDGRNSVGERVASGLYFYTLTAGDFAATRKMLIMK